MRDARFVSSRDVAAKKKTREEGDRGCVSRTTTRDPGNT
jgi:hypothetical protein